MSFQDAATSFLLGVARDLFPVLKLGKNVFVFRDGDVREILSRDQDFTIAPINAANISRHTGPFVLGMDAGPQYDRDIGILRRAVRREDVEQIRTFVRQKGKELAGQLNGQFDVIDAYTREIPYLMLGDYFGVAGPNRAEILHWCRSIFYDIFLNLNGDEAVRNAALKSSEAMNAYLSDIIRERKAALNSGGRLPDDMLSRLITMQGGDAPSFSDEEIPGNLAGVFMGFMEPTNKAVVKILQEFFKRPEVLREARAAAKVEDIDKMLALALEAMRFNPNGPVLLRHSPQEQFIGGEEGRKRRRIPGNKKIWLMVKSAMFDKRSVQRPMEFRSDRPESTYLYFGHGMHTCFGKYVNLVCIPEMLMPLLAREDLFPQGNVEPAGPFPDRWQWESQKSN